MNKKLPVIFGIISAATIPIVAILSGRATYKAHEIWADPNIPTMEKIKHAAKYYIPTAAVATAGIGTNIASQGASSKIITGLTATATGLDAAIRNAWCNRAEHISLGDVTEEPEFIDPDSTDEFVDIFTGRFFRSNFETVNHRLKEFTDYVRSNRFATLDDYFSFLGLSSAFLIGDDYIWDADYMRSTYATDDPGVYLDKNENGRYLINMTIYPEIPILQS